MKMRFTVIDKVSLATDRKFRRRWIEVCGVFESPYCVISEKHYKNSLYNYKPQLSDYQFRKTTKPQPELCLKIVIPFRHFKKINDTKIRHLIGVGAGCPQFNSEVNEECTIINAYTLEITSEDICNKGLFLRRLIREKELGYY